MSDLPMIFVDQEEIQDGIMRAEEFPSLGKNSKECLINEDFQATYEFIYQVVEHPCSGEDGCTGISRFVDVITSVHILTGHP
jgi:hypothetical protein